MSSRLPVFAFGVLLLTAEAHAQGIAIDHKPVGCLVAGKFPKLDACFNPVSELARARAYFRATGAGSDWYYVEMKAGVPCYSGVLPKPKKALIGQTIEYYLDVSNRSLADARTEEIKAYVVEKASDCKAKLPVAPLLNAAHVVVYPAAGSAAAAVVPAGFASAAGLGAAATAAVVGGGVAVATGGVVAATQAGSSPTTTLAPPVVTSPPATLPPATNPPATTTTTTTLPAADVPFSPIFKVYKGGVAVDTATVTGDDPLSLTFDMCQSSGPYRMTYDVVVNGTTVAAGCLSTVTFTTLGAKVGGFATVRRSAGDASYQVAMNVVSMAPGNQPQATKGLTVKVLAPPPPTTTTTTSTTSTTTTTTTMPPPPPTTTTTTTFLGFSPSFKVFNIELVEVTSPTAGDDPYVLTFDMCASLPSSGLTYSVTVDGSPVTMMGCSTDITFMTSGYIVGGSKLAPPRLRGAGVRSSANGNYAVAMIVTPPSGPAQTRSVDVGVLPAPPTSMAPAPTPTSAGMDRAPQRFNVRNAVASLLSDLAVLGGAGQVVANGSAVFPRAGRNPVAVSVTRGVNTVEATLVDARAAGTWSFELGTIPGLRADSLRVITGDIVQIGGEAVVFRLRGRPGERIVFSFER